MDVPDIKYMDYLRTNYNNNKSKNSFTKDIERSKQYMDEAWNLYEEDKFYDALSVLKVYFVIIQNNNCKCVNCCTNYWC